MIQHCQICGRYFRPDPRVGIRQKACRRPACRKIRKHLAQERWLARNPGYFRGRYPIVKEWRKTRSRSMIQDEIPIKKPMRKMIFYTLGRITRRMIQDEIVLKRSGPACFYLYPAEGFDTRHDGKENGGRLSSGV